MTFTAAGIALSVETKATTDNNWQGVQQLAVKVGDEMKPYTVTPSADYKTAELSSPDDPFYWQSTDPITVSAWWPYTDGSTTMPDVVVQADQSSEANFHKSDYICALDQTVEFDGPHALQFSHRTAKVVVNPLVNGDGMTADELAGATIALTGVTTGNEADGTTVTPYQNSIALLPGQQIPADEPFIRITLANGTTYSYKPDEAITLQAGYQYTYTITVNKTGLGMSNVAVSNWGNGAEIAGEAEAVTHTYDASTNTYTVYTAEGLDAWADAVRSRNEDANCTLANDIDYGGKTWGGTGDFSYTGTFDGGGNTLSNMVIPVPQDVLSQRSGLVGYLKGTVQNLVLDDVELQTANGYYGLIAGLNDGTIAGCTVLSSCKIICNSSGYTGGIAGSNGGQITRCHAECSFEGSNSSNHIGGIAGSNMSSITASSYKGSYNVTGNAKAGSLIGRFGGGAATACWTSVKLVPTATMTGMVGRGSDSGALTACYWEGDGITDNGFGTQVTGSNWTDAIDEMNNNLPEDFGWHYVADGGSLPTLVKTE